MEELFEQKTITKEIHETEITLRGRLAKDFLEYLKEEKISPQKQKILSVLNTETEKSLEILSNELNISLPLLSYHMNGNLKSKGLEEQELITKVHLSNGRSGLKLTQLGHELMKFIKKAKGENDGD